MTDKYRPCVAAIIAHKSKPLIWMGRRSDEKNLNLAPNQQAWQFPQGGIDMGENAEQAIIRELFEETGLMSHQYQIIAKLDQALKYDISAHMRNKYWFKKYRGQVQQWFLIQMNDEDASFNLTLHHDQEFIQWEWCKYWHAAEAIIDFKTELYRQGLLGLWQDFCKLYQK